MELGWKETWDLVVVEVHWEVHCKERVELASEQKLLARAPFVEVVRHRILLGTHWPDAKGWGCQKKVS